MANPAQKASSASSTGQRSEQKMGENVIVKSYLIAYNIGQLLGYVFEVHILGYFSQAVVLATEQVTREGRLDLHTPQTCKDNLYLSPKTSSCEFNTLIVAIYGKGIGTTLHLCNNVTS